VCFQLVHMSSYQARQLAANLPEPEPEDDPDASFCQESLELAHIAAVVYRAKVQSQVNMLIFTIMPTIME